MNTTTSTAFNHASTAARIFGEVFTVPIAVALMVACMAFFFAVVVAVGFWIVILIILPFTLYNGELWQTLIVPSYVTIWIVWCQQDIFLKWFHTKFHF